MVLSTESVAIIISIISLIVSAIIFYIQLRRTHGELELQIYQIINEAEKDLVNATVDKIKCRIEDKENREYIDLVHGCAIERYLNAIEIACGEYRDRKIDRKRFKHIYKRNIEKICLEDTYAKYLHNYLEILKLNEKFKNS